MSVTHLGTHPTAASAEPLVQALVAHATLVTDMVWALEWLNSLCDDLNGERWQRNGDKEHPRTREFLDELAKRRKGNDTLNSCAKEANL
jgi:hypothetical protein